MNDLQEYRNKLERLKGKKNQIRHEISAIRDDIQDLEFEKLHIEEARLIIQQVAEDTQRQLEYHIGEACSLAIGIVFDNPYKVRLAYDKKRGRTEASITLERDGDITDAMDSVGGGIVDILSFALRVAMWSLRAKRTRNVFILDEPFKHLSKDLQGRACIMLKRISKELNIQIIMVTHSQALAESADKIFTVSIDDGVSCITEERSLIDFKS